MAQGVAVGMPDETLVVGNLDAAENQPVSRPEAMQIEPDADPKIHLADCSSSRRTRASVRSDGRVILMFLSEPRTIDTG